MLYKVPALAIAAKAGDQMCIDLLLAHGASPSIPFYASTGGDTREFGKNGDVEPKAIGCISGVTALHVSHTMAARQLADAGANITARDSRGRTPFHWAVEDAVPAKVMFFLEKGYPVDDRDRDGATGLALLCAALERGYRRNPDDYLPVLKLLLEAGADARVSYPQSTTIRSRLWAMSEKRNGFWPIFRMCGLLDECFAEEATKASLRACGRSYSLTWSRNAGTYLSLEVVDATVPGTQQPFRHYRLEYATKPPLEVHRQPWAVLISGLA
jgi:hypothetical protein